jgi:hypothetical protein
MAAPLKRLEPDDEVRVRSVCERRRLLRSVKTFDPSDWMDWAQGAQAQVHHLTPMKVVVV